MRYPGAKGKLIHEIGGFIFAYYRLNAEIPYREPFFGSGALGLHIMKWRVLSSAWVNDADPGIAAIWQTILDQPEQLCDAILGFTPSTDAFYSIKSRLLAGMIADPVQLALSKLAIHQISFSGLGVMAGGPLGGRTQRVEGAIASRWNAERLCGEVRRAQRVMQQSNAVVTSLDFQAVIDGPGRAFLYLDPPYYQKGPELYQHAFTESDHLRLADCLRRTTNPWLLSYDDTPGIREMYESCEMVELTDLNYSINTARRMGELLILSPGLPNLFDQVSDKRHCASMGRDIFDE
jgi:DNA adenine methylase